MESGKTPPPDEGLKKFEDNPYSPDRVTPEELVRIFYEFDTPILPVISQRGILLGLILKDDLVKELSDIDRTKNQKLDKIISNLMKKMSFDELIPYIQENTQFHAINLFGEVQKNWSRLDLLSASEQHARKETVEQEIEQTTDDQVLEWMIYLILEHVPRALYAINSSGKTIFFNSLFEEIYESNRKEEVDITFVENSLNNSEKNDLFYKNNGSYFLNTDMNFYYEKVPMTSDDKTVGYLIFCDKDPNIAPNDLLPDVGPEGMSLSQTLSAIERNLIVTSLKENDEDIKETAKSLKVTRKSLLKKLEKHSINFTEKDQ